MYRKPPEGILKPCPICGKEFYVAPAKISRRKYCSRACMAIGYRRPDDMPPKQTKVRINKICPTCNKEFHVIPGLVSRVYCNRACMTIAYQQMYSLSAKPCPTCGKEFKPEKSRQ